MVASAIASQTRLKTATAQSLGFIAKELTMSNIEPTPLMRLKEMLFPEINPCETKIYAKSKIVTAAHRHPDQANNFILPHYIIHLILKGYNGENAQR